MSGFKPAPELSHILAPAYAPCEGLAQECRGVATWSPKIGHVPRGFTGAFRSIAEVELVLLVAEPGDPYPGDSYPPDASPAELVERTSSYTFELLQKGRDQYHRNMRYLLDGCFPGLTFEEQLCRTWLTETYLCSAPKEGGAVPGRACQACRRRFLDQQLALFPRAVVVALGGKARDRTRGLGQVIAATAIAPPGCNRRDARASWDAAIAQVRERNGGDKGRPQFRTPTLLTEDLTGSEVERILDGKGEATLTGSTKNVSADADAPQKLSNAASSGPSGMVHRSNPGSGAAHAIPADIAVLMEGALGCRTSSRASNGLCWSCDGICDLLTPITHSVPRNHRRNRW